MICRNAAIKPVPPTLWGLTPMQLHEYFWASRGVQVVRRGSREEILPNAEQYLLLDPDGLALFRLRGMIDLLSWVQPAVMYVRLRVADAGNYRERVIADSAGNFVGFRRSYGGIESGVLRAALTRDVAVARAWQSAPDARSAWRVLRALTQGARREVMNLTGNAFDASDDESVARFVRELVRFWGSPSSTVPNVRRAGSRVWAHAGARVGANARFTGPVWIGAGRTVDVDSVVGPAALWDDPAVRPASRGVTWDAIEPSKSSSPSTAVPTRPTSVGQRAIKRGFDVVFSALVILLTFPLWLIVMAAVWLDDGRPLFFVHRRETLGGREFPCIKFRSMRKDADQLKEQLATANKADGPQFFIEHDPRLTRVGRVIRKLNIDELPQFLNVLAGDMSVVGPRPSPHVENQYCPPWREARLSVRAGITGLWQVSRTRRRGLDFQEWIKYDLEYAERQSWWLDLVIIWRTCGVLLGGIFR